MSQSTDDSPTRLYSAWSFVRSTSDASARGWLKSMAPVAMHDSLYILAVANDFTRERVETRLRPSIEALLSDYFDRPIRLAIDVDPNLVIPEEPDDAEPVAPAPAVEPAALRVTSPRGSGDRLNP